MTIPTADALAVAGIATIVAFGLWKTQVTPRLERRQQAAPNI